MRIGNTIFAVLAGIAGLGMSVSSCTKFTKVSLKNEGTIYMPQAAGTRAVLSLLLIDSAQDVVFGAAYGGLQYPSQDIPVTFKLDTPLIASYNATNGTSYVALPAASYTVSGLSSVIKAGQTSSDPLIIAIQAKKLVRGTHYLLPVTLLNASGSKTDSSLSTAWFSVDSIYIRKRDITSQGTLSVSNENGGGPDAGEGSPHLVDDDLNTKYLASVSSDFWYQLQFPTAQVVNEYTMTSGNDASGRDPKDWEFLGSNDGTSWDNLDTKVGETFAARQMTKIYDVNNNKAYTYYRVHVTHNNGSSLFQQTEWRLVQFY